jgi:hypothetical protein
LFFISPKLADGIELLVLAKYPHVKIVGPIVGTFFSHQCKKVLWDVGRFTDVGITRVWPFGPKRRATDQARECCADQDSFYESHHAPAFERVVLLLLGLIVSKK